MKVSELQGAALDWAVAHCNYTDPDTCSFIVNHDGFKPSTEWARGGPIIEQEKIEWQWLPAADKARQYGARKPSLGGLNRTFCMDGPTVLIAAMRCYVASKLGDETELPEELNHV